MQLREINVSFVINRCNNWEKSMYHYWKIQKKRNPSCYNNPTVWAKFNKRTYGVTNETRQWSDLGPIKSFLIKGLMKTMKTSGPPLSPWQASFPPCPPEKSCQQTKVCTCAEHDVTDVLIGSFNPVFPVAGIFPSNIFKVTIWIFWPTWSVFDNRGYKYNPVQLHGDVPQTGRPQHSHPTLI